MRTVLTRLDRIFEEGFTAYQQGRPYHSNPYDDPEDRKAWYEGWDYGKVCGKGCK